MSRSAVRQVANLPHGAPKVRRHRVARQDAAEAGTKVGLDNGFM